MCGMFIANCLYLNQPSIFNGHICILDRELDEILWGRVGGIRSWCYGGAVFVLKEDREDTECSIACSNSNKLVSIHSKSAHKNGR